MSPTATTSSAANGNVSAATAAAAARTADTGAAAGDLRQGPEHRAGRRHGPADSVLVFGEDVGALGGVFRITDGLTKRFGRTAASTPRWPSPASWAWPSAWR